MPSSWNWYRYLKKGKFIDENMSKNFLENFIIKWPPGIVSLDENDIGSVKAFYVSTAELSESKKSEGSRERRASWRAW